MQSTKQISHREWVWVAGWSILILIITALPYLYGAAVSTSTQQFSGFVIGLEDGNSYLAKMQQGRSGYWLFRLAYTSEPHQAEPFFIYYILLGKIAGLVKLPNVWVFHLSRIFTVPFGLLAFYSFAAYFTNQVKARRLALVIFGSSAGLGWLWLVAGGASELGRMPVDLWVPDASYFLAALTFPHLPLAQGLLLLFSVTGLEFIQRGQRRTGLLAAGFGLAVSLIHPHTLPVIGLILGLYILGRGPHSRKNLTSCVIRLGLIVLPSVPYLLYVALVFVRNPAFVAWRAQSLTYSPAPVHYLLGFGITLILAIIGLAITRKQAGRRFLHIWLIAVPVLVYLPIALQRRFLDGYQAPLAVLAAVGLLWLVQKIPGKLWQTGLLILTVLIMSITNLLLLTGAVVTISQRPQPVFIQKAQADAARWLDSQKSQAVVLSAHQTGNYLPTVADVRTFVGHGPETIESSRKNALVLEFFVTPDDQFRQNLLQTYNIDYLYYGPAERALGDFSPEKTSYLNAIYDNGTAQIYQVVDVD